MIVRISTAVLDAVVAHAAASPQREVCGLLFGAGDRVAGATPTGNVAAENATQFEIDPQALFAAIRAERQGGPRLIGHYHSHPSGEPAPSACDAAAAEPGKLWLIVAGQQARAWLAQAAGPVHGAFAPVTLEVTT